MEISDLKPGQARTWTMVGATALGFVLELGETLPRLEEFLNAAVSWPVPRPLRRHRSLPRSSRENEIGRNVEREPTDSARGVQPRPIRPTVSLCRAVGRTMTVCSREVHFAASRRSFAAETWFRMAANSENLRYVDAAPNGRTVRSWTTRKLAHC